MLLSVAQAALASGEGAAQQAQPGWVPAPLGYPPPAAGYPPPGLQFPGAAPPLPERPAAAAVGATPSPAAAPAPIPVAAPADAEPVLVVPSAVPPSAAPLAQQPPAAPVVAEPVQAQPFPDVAAGAGAGVERVPRQRLADAGQQAGKQAGEASGITSDDSPECMRCHWMETMAYRDKETGRIVNLSIDRDAYEHSVHHELACRDCHDRGYKHYPHRSSSVDEGLQCVECHEERQDDEHHQPPMLDGFAHQYQESVHARQDDEPFSCFSCHNPHAFRPLPNDTPVPEVVAANNNLCLDCHTELRSPVPKGHDWLPRPQQHWASVRCIDCHTPAEGRDLYAPSHELLGAEESNQNCVECHSQGGQLLAQLYVHRAEQEREQEGFFAHAIYNDAYIIGMSRSPLIDMIGLAIVGLMVLGILAHGFGRYLAYRRAQKPEREAP
jgi:hypothetical protein